jgi:hypothetical protein
MSTERDPQRIVLSWLRSDEHVSADRLLDVVLFAVDTTPQRQSSWLAWRSPFVSNTVRIALAAAAVVALALIGYQLLAAPNVGGPPPSPSPTETPIPSPAATPVAVVDFTTHAGGGAELMPGEYRITTASPVGVVITVPDEPFGGFPSAWFKALYDWGPWHQTNEARVGVVDVSNLYVNPCRAPEQGLRDPAIGPSVADLASALGTIPEVAATEPVEAQLDGIAGQLVELTAGNRTDSCVDDAFVWTSTYSGASLLAPDPGDLTRIWILDVGGTRLVVWASEDAEFTDHEAMQTLVDSIQIEAP